MKRNQLKFVGGSAVIVLTVVYLALANGGGDNLARTVSIAELKKPSEARYTQRLTVAGRVKPCSIVRQGRIVQFTIHDKDDKELTFPMEYRGKEPLPDLFKDEADVNVDGRLDQSGVFIGDLVAAKCASKYGEMGPPGAAYPKCGNDGAAGIAPPNRS
jgi:cytochrome c-type biogenesis protein CcmE